MSERIETFSRHAAVGALLASAAFFTWWGSYAASWWPASVPFFGGVVVAFLAAAVGVHRQRAWGPGFATGLATLSILTMLPVGLRLPVALFLGSQVFLLSALTIRSFAAPHQAAAWRHTGLAFAVGLATPWLLVVGLLPGLACGTSLLGFGGLALGAGGAAAAFRGKTWGLFGMLAAIPLLLAIPPSGVGCQMAPHDRAGELAALAFGLAALPWVGPLVRGLIAKRS